MNSATSQCEIVTVAADHEKLLSTAQIPKSFAEEWHTGTSGPGADSSSATKTQTLTTSIQPYLWLIDTALSVFVASLLLAFFLRTG
ncbi:hypothetical protein F5Y12DRAFT_767100 [Xylaria sp. FL1777]|nr:hypothetical protein F5Y12DRAFT_767100 [Xylaria sp. FL1777]